LDKALWVVRDKIATKRAIDDLMADATTRGIHDLVIQVRGRGDAYYASTLEPRAEPLLGSDFDPLGHCVRAGAWVGVRVHAWGNVFFVWSSADGRLPLAREHLTEIVRGYRVEGFHYDYVRYPQVTYASSPEDHAAVTALVRAGAERLRAARPGLVISAAVFPDPDVTRDRVLQRWPEWAREGCIDLLCPMAYRRDTAEVARVLAKSRAAAPSTRMWGGLMAYAGERELVRDQVRAVRDAGCEGAILFAYDPAQRDLLDVFAAS
jgi:uncharacterized lipoprotein YddW (UPF0748 family)